MTALKARQHRHTAVFVSGVAGWQADAVPGQLMAGGFAVLGRHVARAELAPAPRLSADRNDPQAGRASRPKRDRFPACRRRCPTRPQGR